VPHATTARRGFNWATWCAERKYAGELKAASRFGPLTTRARRGRGSSSRLQGLGWHRQSRHMRVPGRRSSLLAWPGPGRGHSAQRAARGQRPGSASLSGSQSRLQAVPPPASAREVSVALSDPEGRGSSSSPPRRLPRPGPPSPSVRDRSRGSRTLRCSTYADGPWRRAPSIRERMTPRCRQELNVRLFFF
jgi:hypothetical protein